MPKAKAATSSTDVYSKRILALMQNASKLRKNEARQILTLLQKAAKSQNDDSKQILTMLQYLFILEAARSGMSITKIRKVLKMQSNRVTAITANIKQAAASKDDK